MRWFIPSWNGDLRLDPDPDSPKTKTLLSVVKPTEHEKEVLRALGASFVERGWFEKAVNLDEVNWRGRRKIIINAPLEQVGPVVVKMMRSDPATLTCVKFKDGQVETCEMHKLEDPEKWLKEKSEKHPYRDGQKPPADEAAVTVTRPTPSCPDCFLDAVGPATEVLLSFLTEEQHRTWSKDRYIIVRGQLTGHRYLIAHRNSPVAVGNKRICMDLDDHGVVHFHDWSVPPEEEVLAAKLILEHREPWLRNEATCLSGGGGFAPNGFTTVFKNPFGDIMDGVADASLTKMVGDIARALTEGPT